MNVEHGHGGLHQWLLHQTRRKRTPKFKPLPTIWEVPDHFWLRILPILEEFWPAKPTGRHHANWRTALNGIIFRMRSGCQWDQLPRKFGPKSTVHDWFQRWCAGGVMQADLGRSWSPSATNLGAVDWQWQSADGRLGKARFGGEKGGQKPHGSREKGHQEVACWLTATAGRWGVVHRRGQRE